MKETLTIENAEIFSRNFSGKAGEYNPPGQRNFCVYLDDETAETLKENLWNIRYTKPRDPDDSPRPFVQVKVNFENPKRIPNIFIVTSRGSSILKEKDVNILDFAEIEYVELVIRGYQWEEKKPSRVKAYLQSIAVTIKEDPIVAKYTNIPESAADTIGGCGSCEACDGSCKTDDD